VAKPPLIILQVQEIDSGRTTHLFLEYCMRTYWNMLRGFDRNIILYLTYNSSMAFAYIGILNVLVNLYLLRLGYDTEFIGTMLASGMLTWGVLALPAGALGSRLGIKRTIVAGMFTLSLSALMLILAGGLNETWRAPGLVVSWMLVWGGAALVSVNSLPYVMAITTDENRSYVFSVQQTLAALVSLAGALISGILPGVLASLVGRTLDQPLPYQLTMLLSPLFYLAAALVFINAKDIPSTSHETGGSKAQTAPVGVFVLLFLIVVFQSSSDGAARTFFNIYLDTALKVPVAQIGATLGLAQVLPVVGSLVIPVIMARMGSRGVMLVSNSLSILFIALIAAVPNSSFAAVAFMGFTGVGSITQIARSIFSQEVVSPRWRTTTSALATIGVALGWAASAWLGGTLITAIGFQGLFWLGAFLALLASLLTLLDTRLSKRRVSQANFVDLPEEQLEP
jgi:MFS family permease